MGYSGQTRAAAILAVAAAAFYLLEMRPAAPGQSTASLSVRVMVVAPSCSARQTCVKSSAALPASRAEEAHPTPPVAVWEEEQNGRQIRTVVY